MAYMQMAFGAIAVGVILFVGYLLIAQVGVLMPSADQLNDSNFTTSMNNSQAVILAGFGLVAVGVIIVAAFGIINLWK